MITGKNETDVTPLSTSSTLDHQRWRFRFRKEGDLRWISHRDLVRVWERLCRRAGLVLRMSEGFHPKPKLSFPSALALGIEALDEVMELELVTLVDPAVLPRQLNALAPAGLIITRAEAVGQAAGKARVRAMRYQFPVPDERRAQVERAVAQLQACSTLLMERANRQQPIDIKADLVSVALGDGALGDGDGALGDGTVCFCLRATDRASARPREVLQALGLADLEQQGYYLTRSAVELTEEATGGPP